MSGQTKFILGLGGLCLLGFFLMMGMWSSPPGSGGRQPNPVHLPNPEELGVPVPSTPPVAPAPASKTRLGIAPASKSSNKLMPPPKEVRRMQKEGSVVY